MSFNSYPETAVNTATWDLNTADPQSSVIPKGTIAKVILLIRAGGFNDPSLGATDGWATISKESNAVYLNCECRVLEGPYRGRSVWTKIGLQGSKEGSQWGNMGRSFARAIVNSAKGLSEKDNSPEAVAARNIKGPGDLNQLEFFARIDVEEDSKGMERNTINIAIPKDHKDYPAPGSSSSVSSTAPTLTEKPNWARQG